MEAVLPTVMVLVALVALISPIWLYFLSKRSKPELIGHADLDKVSKFIYDLEDPETLVELAILTDVRRLLLHMELTEGRQRLG